jgi:hypothetical protein
LSILERVVRRQGKDGECRCPEGVVFVVIAHHGGLPVEELVMPLVSAGGALLVAARLFIARLQPRSKRRMR